MYLYTPKHHSQTGVCIQEDDQMVTWSGKLCHNTKNALEALRVFRLEDRILEGSNFGCSNE